MSDRPTPEIDLALLGGFRYGCRPDCGLCCYAEPLVEREEAAALVRLLPAVDLIPGEGGFHLAAHPDGGSCRLLVDRRCRVHSARPSRCREYPLSAHIADRVQATVILSCPGVDLAPLREYRGPGGQPAPEGFGNEIAALTARSRASIARRLDESRRRRRRIVRALTEEGRWEAESEVRRRLGARLPRVGADDFPAEDPPSADDGLDRLPLVFDGRTAPVGFSLGLGGWELAELRPTGGVAHSLGVFPPPGVPPPLVEGAQRLIDGYLRYWLERDALFGAVHLEMLRVPGGTVGEWVEAELRGIAATAISRAHVLASARRGSPGPLSEADVVDGVRATDQDLLDRPTWGGRL